LTEQPHLTPHVRASAGLLTSRATGSFDATRIDSGALDWLKAGESAGNTPKHAEIGLSELPKILSSDRWRRPINHPSGKLSLIRG
jgi:hypothetical protein